MNDYAKLADKAGDQVLGTLKSAYGVGTEAVSTASRWAADFIPQLPEMPFTDRLPTPRELTKVYFDFAASLTKLQRDYAIGLLDAIEPVTRKVMPALAKARPASVKKAAA